MLTLLCFLTCFITILMALVGVVGGVITSVILRTFNHPHFSARNLACAWGVALTTGGVIWMIARFLAKSLFNLIVQGPYLWGWGIIPETLSIAVASVAIGIVGACMMNFTSTNNH